MKGLARTRSLVVEEFYRTPWAVLPETYATMQRILHRWASGVVLSREEIESVTEGRREPVAAEPTGSKGARAVAVIQVFGVLAQRSHIDDTSTFVQGVDPIKAAFNRMLGDDSVGSIVLEIDSPGGSVFGVQELADAIFAARGEKKVVAVANSLAASAAYWIASAAEEVVVTPSGAVGSIGVISAHVDQSKYLENEGIAVTFVSAGKYKTEGNSFEPLTDEARDFLQSMVDGYYQQFVNAVAAGRDVKSGEVRNGFGEGRVLTAKSAKSEGMVDRIETMDDTLARLASSRRAQRPLANRAKLRLDLAAIS